MAELAELHKLVVIFCRLQGSSLTSPCYPGCEETGAAGGPVASGARRFRGQCENDRAGRFPSREQLAVTRDRGSQDFGP